MSDVSRVEELFDAALDLPLDEVDRFLVGECQGDTALLARLRKLLSADRSHNSFLATPAAQAILDAGAIAELTAGSVFNERYEVITRLGQEQSGTVYEVRDARTRRRRSLKVMHPQLVAEAAVQRRFDKEATVTACITSDHIADVYDAGVDKATGSPFLVRELVRGTTLADVEGAMSPADVAALLMQAAFALDKAHRLGIVHRGLKPETMLVTHRDGGDPVLKLVDFGLAKVAASSRAGTAYLLEAPLFMAVEQIDGASPPGPQADVYALGQIAYALLTGEAYFTEEAQASKRQLALLRRILKGAPETASERALRRTGTTLSRAFDAWFARSTATEPSARFDGVIEQMETLGDALEPPPDGFGDGGDSVRNPESVTIPVRPLWPWLVVAASVAAVAMAALL